MDRMPYDMKSKRLTTNMASTERFLRVYHGIRGNLGANSQVGRARLGKDLE